MLFLACGAAVNEPRRHFVVLLTYEVAIRNPAMAICLRNIAAADERRRKRGAQARSRRDLLPWKRYSKAR
jgi:hypothetical protein